MGFWVVLAALGALVLWVVGKGPAVAVRCLAFGCRCHLTPSVAAFGRW